MKAYGGVDVLVAIISFAYKGKGESVSVLYQLLNHYAINMYGRLEI
jgi:hypothetical protein